MNAEWKLTGEYLESCSCKGACPCLFLGLPTEESCAALVGWHIDSGSFGDIRLDGLNVAVALDSPGHMAEGNWKVVLYLDAAADDAQREALAQIFSGQVGGHPALLGSFIGEVLGVERAPITYVATGRERSLSIGGGDSEALIEAIEGQGGATVTIGNHPMAVAPGHPLAVAKSKSLRHRAHGLDFELQDRMAFFSPFDYAGP
ncbi:MAG TPA: DUF1326 domain-containing protein [Rhodocyclaceae bacterium]|nr:DUF1326 domain-containing protein [Rhodocyclaceae bacterium]